MVSLILFGPQESIFHKNIVKIYCSAFYLGILMCITTEMSLLQSCAAVNVFWTIIRIPSQSHSTHSDYTFVSWRKYKANAFLTPK